MFMMYTWQVIFLVRNTGGPWSEWSWILEKPTTYLGPPVLSSSIILSPLLFVFSFVTIFGHINFFIMYIHSIVMFRNYVKPCHNPWEMRPVSFLLVFFFTVVFPALASLYFLGVEAVLSLRHPLLLGFFWVVNFSHGL